MLHQLLLLTGHLGSGKSFIAEYLRDNFGFHILSVASPIKKIVYEQNPLIRIKENEFNSYQNVLSEMGYAKMKELPEVRKLWQRTGDVLRDQCGENVLTESLIMKMETILDDSTFSKRGPVRVVIDDIRLEYEPHQIARCFLQYPDMHNAAVHFVRVQPFTKQYNPLPSPDILNHNTESFVDKFDVTREFLNDKLNTSNTIDPMLMDLLYNQPNWKAFEDVKRK